MVEAYLFISGAGCGFVLCFGLLLKTVRDTIVTALRSKDAEIRDLRALVAYKESVIRIVAAERRGAEEMIFEHRRASDRVIVGPWH